MAVELTKTEALFSGTGVSSVYAPGFYANAAVQISVTVDGVLQTQGDKYTISGIGNSGGVTITGNFALGSAVFIERATPITQEVDTKNNETILEDVLDAQFDKLTLISQELDGKVKRAVTVPKGETGLTLPSAASRAGKYIVFAGDGSASLSSGTGNDTALRTDLAASGGAALVSQSASVSVLTALQRIETYMNRGRTYGDPVVLDFSTMLQNERVDAMHTVGSPTAAINSNSELEVDSIWSVSSNRVFLPAYRFREGIFRALIRRNSAADGSIMIRFMDKAGNGRAIWSGGANLEVGFITAGLAVTSLGTPATLAGAAGDLVWIEMIVGPTGNGSAILGRSWKDGDPRPAAAQVTGTFTAAINGIERNEGYVSISNFNATKTAKVSRIEIHDGQRGIQVNSRAHFSGRAFPRFEGGKLCHTTIRGGDRIRLLARGTAGISYRYAATLGVVSGNVPVVDVYVNGVYNSTVTLAQPTLALQNITIVTGLNTAIENYIEIRVRGIHENNNKWILGAGICSENFTPTTAGGIIAPYNDDRHKMLFIGDSTTEGIVARGTPTSPSNSAGDLSWPVLACETLGLQAIVNGFGGVGLTVDGSGGIPRYYNAGAVLPDTPFSNSPAFYYMKDRAIDTYNEGIKFIVVNLGINDFPLAAATFQSGYLAFAQELLKRFPGVQKMWLMRPMLVADRYSTQISAVVTTLNDPRVSYMDTSTWSLTYTDGVHLNLAGHATAANYFVSAVGDLQNNPWV